MRDSAPELLAAARKHEWSPEELLRALAQAESDVRAATRTRRLTRLADFPESKTLGEFDLTAAPISGSTLDQLASLRWLGAHESVCFAGSAGTGKSHLLIAIGQAAVAAGYRVRYVLTSQLVNELADAARVGRLGRLIARHSQRDLLCLDEVGYVALGGRGPELLFQLLTECHRRSAVAVAALTTPLGWSEIFADRGQRAAIVERFGFQGRVITTGTVSYRDRRPPDASPRRASGVTASDPTIVQPRRAGIDRFVQSGSTAIAKLTPSERRVSELAVAGLSNPEISRHLHISPSTVKTHLAHIYRKLGVDGRVTLTALVAREAWVGSEAQIQTRSVPSE